MVTNAPSPLVGFNNNVRHKGKVFHIQTEDSGVKYPHVITHLFADGGRILKSVKTSYEAHLGAANFQAVVRELMKAQHKAMFIALRAGEYDAAIEQLEAGSPQQPSRTPARRPAWEEPPPDRRPAWEDAELESLAPAPSAARSTPATATSALATAVAATPTQVRASIPADSVSVAALDRAAQEAQKSSVVSADPQPPPTGAQRSADSPGSPDAASPPGRYSASRPASIFATARPSEIGAVFGEDMISNRSLDEVILGFLSEEFGTGSGKEDGGK